MDRGGGSEYIFRTERKEANYAGSHRVVKPSRRGNGEKVKGRGVLGDQMTWQWGAYRNFAMLGR